ncbi:hypothetical protein BO70DRAFT_356014 [Aspergillus heteromorphus CBS 117.55]|uniref:Uncharacterized protein n=1 Tax=Aspergillus heteromorphus CBS 117.55 TaxID=1448321 RepID=A0A317VB32_9EURO|nr:uncharacterized protein BO70DRAFT_356014 [Aspergillus heteromorphus CBS 117.55]PWY69130.1 hypothetical protein BO70DRAFT_356014 [Aspergillus heteromorphus CBS 117.55]
MPSSPKPPSTTHPTTTTNTNTTTTTPTPTPLESDLLTHLTATPALDDLHTTLLSSLQRLGWTEKIRRLAQELLRGGRCERFEDVFDAVVASAEGRGHPFLTSSNGHANTSTDANNHNNDNDHDRDHDNGGEDGDGNGSGSGDNTAAGIGAGDEDVRIPQVVVEQGVRAIKEVLREVVVLEVEDEGDILAEEGHGNHTGGKEEGGGGGGGEKDKDKDREKDKKEEKEKEKGTGKSGSTASPGVKKKVKAKGK